MAFRSAATSAALALHSCAFFTFLTALRMGQTAKVSAVHVTCKEGQNAQMSNSNVVTISMGNPIRNLPGKKLKVQLRLHASSKCCQFWLCLDAEFHTKSRTAQLQVHTGSMLQSWVISASDMSAVRIMKACTAVYCLILHIQVSCLQSGQGGASALMYSLWATE